MGTSSPFSGPGPATPLIPSWLPSEGAPIGPPDGTPEPEAPPNAPLPPIPELGREQRFKDARSNFTRFAGSADRRSLGNALGNYVRSGTGGKSGAARKMGSSRTVAAGIAGFIGEVQSSGTGPALAKLGLADCVGKDAIEVFPRLMEVLCPAGGSIDEGIARQAFAEAIVDLCQESEIPIEEITSEMWGDFLVDFIARSIEGRVIADIGSKLVAGPKSVEGVEAAERTMHSYIVAAVREAVGEAFETLGGLTASAIGTLVGAVYEGAFGVWEEFGED